MKMSTAKIEVAIALAVSLFALTPGQAQAALLTIDDTMADNKVTVSACGFVGVTIGGAMGVDPCGGGIGSTTDLTDTIFTFNVRWNGQNGTGHRTLYLVEASNDPNILLTDRLVSDIFDYSWITEGPLTIMNGSFESDFEGNLLPLNRYLVGLNDSVFIENGEPASFSLLNLSGEIRSDLDNPVPEPGSLVLVGLGLACAVFSRRKKA
jgi:hypothetical protein